MALSLSNLSDIKPVSIPVNGVDYTYTIDEHDKFITVYTGDLVAVECNMYNFFKFRLSFEATLFGKDGTIKSEKINPDTFSCPANIAMFLCLAHQLFAADLERSKNNVVQLHENDGDWLDELGGYPTAPKVLVDIVIGDLPLQARRNESGGITVYLGSTDHVIACTDGIGYEEGDIGALVVMHYNSVDGKPEYKNVQMVELDDCISLIVARFILAHPRGMWIERLDKYMPLEVAEITQKQPVTLTDDMGTLGPKHKKSTKKRKVKSRKKMANKKLK